MNLERIFQRIKNTMNCSSSNGTSTPFSNYSRFSNIVADKLHHSVQSKSNNTIN